jgi:acetolactate synthase I/II/III large subunit
MFRTFTKFKTNIRCFTSMSGANVIYQKLQEHNVKDVFMYSGGSIMPLIDQLQQGKINYYINTHEQNCGHVATGYAKSSGKTGVVITTNGPGLTKTINPIRDANTDSTPLVVLSGQVKQEFIGNDAFQEVPATEITKSITKWSYCLTNINELPKVIDKAFHIANEGKKGVVHIDIPKCVLTDTLKFRSIDSKYNTNNLSTRMYMDYNPYTIEDCKEREYQQLETKEPLERCLEAIKKAEKPILYVGQGCIKAQKELNQLIDNTNIPITTTIHAKGIYNESNDLSLQWCGIHGSAAANYAIQEADCIIGIGTRFDNRTTGCSNKYAPVARSKKSIINVNIESSDFNKTVDTDINIHLDSSNFLRYLNTKVNSNKLTNEWNSRIKELKKNHYFKYNEPDNGKINAQMAINSINNYCNNRNNGDAIITTGVGNHQMMTYQFIDGDYPSKILSSGSLGAMGTGLPYAIGTQISNPNKLVINIDGDSSFMTTMSYMKTIIENKLPIKIAIMNDSKQIMVNIWEKLYFEDRYVASDNIRNPSFTELIRSFDFNVFKCSSNDNLQQVTNKFLSNNGPAICEYVIEPEICLPLVGPGKALDEMILFDKYHNDEYNKENISDHKHIPS